MAEGLNEAERNQRLRRADWRFLLPSPRPRRVLCRARGALADAVASIAGEVVDRARDGECDLAVAQDPDARTLAVLRAALRPGGVCYTEWHPRTGGRGAVVRALHAAGFDEVACYRPWPRASRLPVLWTPLDAPAAAAYVRERARLRGGRVRRALAGLVRAGADGLRGRLSGAICAIARTAGAEPGPSHWLRENWEAWGLGPAPAEPSLLLVTGGPRTVSKVVLLAFAEPSGGPVVALKAPRVLEAVAGVEREAEVLRDLGGRKIAGVPRLLARREVDGVPIVAETALQGRPLDTLLGPRTLRTWSVRVAGWLATLGRGGQWRSADSWRATVVEPTLASFEEMFGSVVDRGLLAEGAAIARGIGDLPGVVEQRDFGPWNVLVTPAGDLAVLDWESATLDGLPLLDLWYYLAYGCFSADRAWELDTRVASYRRSLAPAGVTGAVRRECLDRYGAALGLDRSRLAPLRALVWLIHARSDFRHAAADAAGTPPAARLRRSLFLALWSAEVRDLARG